MVIAGIGAAACATASSGAAAGTGKDINYLDAFTALILDWRRKDIDAVLRRVTDDVVWHTHVGSPPAVGKAAMRQVLEPMAASVSDVRWRLFNHAISGNRLLVEGVDDFVTPEGRRVAIPYMGILEFRDDLICAWRDYFDRGIFVKMKAGEPAPESFAPLLDRPAVP
jgi:limonene-1,2-epoxide hydrolase